MGVDLDQIEFYHGPNRPPLSTSAKSVPTDYTSAHVPQHFQHSFSTGLGLRPGLCEVPLGQSPPLTGTTHAWNIFDFEINSVYGPTQSEITKDVEPAVTTKIPAVRHIPFHRGSSALAFSEPVPSTDSARAIPCPAGPDYTHPIPGLQGDDLPDAVIDTKEVESSQLSCVPCVTASVSKPEEANCAFGDSQQESAKRKLSTTEPSNCLCPGEYENDTEQSQTSDLGGHPCSSANEVPERAEDPCTAEDTSVKSCPSSPPTAHSTSKCSRVRTNLASNIPVRSPSIAVVVPVPSPSWKQGATRRSTRAAAAVCKKRLRSGRGTGNDQDGNTTFYATEQRCQKRKKRRPSTRPLSGPSDSSVPVSSHCSGAIQGVHGSAILTVDTNSGLKPAYFFTFVPDPSPMLSRPHTAVIQGNKDYTSDENALLVRLKEKEAMSWSEITAHFPGRNMSSLQVHYSTKLRRKASSRSGRPRRRE